ncbi:MAG: hypothetical protein QM756_06080 [Polyangiaceae bacterium]
MGGSLASGGAKPSGGTLNGNGGSSSLGGRGSGGALSSGGVPSSGGSSSVTSQGGALASGGKSSGGAVSSGGSSVVTPSGGPSCGFVNGGAAGSSGGPSAGAAAGGAEGSVDAAGGTLGSAGGPTLSEAGAGAVTASGGDTAAGDPDTGPRAAFCDDFEDGDAGGWLSPSCTWSVASAESLSYTSSGGACQSLADTAVLTDQVIEANVQVTHFGGTSNSYRAGLLSRYTEGSSSYYVLALAGNGSVRLMHANSNLSGSGSCADATLTPSSSGWYTLRLEVSGLAGQVRLRSFVNQSLVHDCLTSSGSASSGRSGVFTYGSNTTALFDEVRIWVP